MNCHNCSNATRYPDARVRCDLTGDLVLAVCAQFKHSDGCKLCEPVGAVSVKLPKPVKMKESKPVKTVTRPNISKSPKKDKVQRGLF